MNALIATRFSDPKQIGGTSTEVQVESCQAYCNSQGFKILGYHRVEAESAKATNQARVKNLLEFCKSYKGQADLLVVYKLDRFARDTGTHFYLKSELLKIGISLRSATEHIDESALGELTETILSAIAQFDNSMKRDRVKSSMRHLLEKGTWPWRPPVGYKPTRTIFNKAGVAEIDEACSFHVQFMFKSYASGVSTISEISKDLNQKTVFDYQRRKINFTPQMIHKTLSNPFYHVELKVDTWGEKFLGAHQPIIDQKTYSQCYERLHPERGEQKSRLHFNPDFPLRDRLSCGICKGPMTAAMCAGKRKKFPLYYCPNTGCPNPGKKSINKNEFEPEFYQFLNDVKPSPEHFIGFRGALIRRYETRQLEFETRSYSIRQLLQKLDEDKTRLIDLGKNGALHADELKNELEKVRARMTELKNELNGSHEDEFKVQMLIDYAESFFRTPGTFWLDASPANKVKIQRILFPKGLVYTYPGFSNTELAPGFEVIKQFADVESTLVTPTGVEPVLPA